jgi:hypothetical protein
MGTFRKIKKILGIRKGELFKGIFEYGILITHNHRDYDNLVETVASMGYSKGSSDQDSLKIAEVFEEDWETFVTKSFRAFGILWGRCSLPVTRHKSTRNSLLTPMERRRQLMAKYLEINIFFVFNTCNLSWLLSLSDI